MPPPAASPDVLPDEEGEIEFRTLIELLTLTAAINNNGHAILRQHYEEDYVAPLELKLDKRLLLNAFASIFVRDHEIIAIAASENRVNISVSPGDHSRPGVYELVAMQDEPAHIIHDEPQYKELDVEADAIAGLTAIDNPRRNFRRPWEHRKRNDGKREEEGTPYFTLAPRGDSHFTDISTSNWSWIDVVE
jgi:hypothetical protein